MSPKHVVATLLALVATPLVAMDSHIVGPRALGLGGAGTAAADDHTASYYNPAIYGFFSRTGEKDAKLDADPNYIGRKDWGIGLADATVSVEVRGRLADSIEQLSGTDFGKLSDLGSATSKPEDLQAAVTAMTLLQTFDAKTDNALVLANVGVLNTRILHVGFGVRQFAEGLVSIADLDRANLGFGTSLPGGSITQGIIDTAQATGLSATYTPTLITAGSTAYITLTDILSGYTGSVDDAIAAIDKAAVEAGITQADIDKIIGDSSVPGALGVLGQALSATGLIEDNQTAILTGGYTVTEIPLTVGVALNDYLSVGGNAKLMIGKVAAAKARLVDQVDKLADLMQDSFAEAEQTVTGGIDLGFAARCSWAQVGLSARNLNRPVLKGGSFKDADGQAFTVADVTLEPQLSLGVALYPFETVVLTADIDVLENKTTYSSTSQRTGALMNGIDRDLKVEYATQRVGGGLEWNIARFLALRGGYSMDLAETETGGMIHAGLGLNLWALRFDLAGAVATKTIEVDGQDMPRAASVSAGLTIDF
jgi:hypothetical protein